MKIRDREQREMSRHYPEPTAAPWVHQPHSAKQQINGNTKRAMIAAAARRIQAKRQVSTAKVSTDYVKHAPDKLLTSLVFSRPRAKETV